MRIGLGFDVHRLVPGRPCVLGGVRIPYDRGPVGHSDGDAVLHAFSDALLGAAGLGDIGTLFPDGDPAWKDADSARILGEVWKRVDAAGFRLESADIVVATEGPRIAPYRDAIRARIAAIVKASPEIINVKGKTLEGLGALAAAGGVAAQAVCLLALRNLPQSSRTRHA